MLNPFRGVGALLAAFALGAFFTIAPAKGEIEVRDTPTEFIGELSSRGLMILSDRRMNAIEKEEALRLLYRARFSRHAVASAIFGRAMAAANSSERRFLEDFLEAYIVRLLVHDLGEYFGDFDGVIWVVDHWEPDGNFRTVYSHVEKRGKRLNVLWRIREEADGTLRVYDVKFESLSLALTQRREFEKLFYHLGASVPRFIEELKSILRLPRKEEGRR